MFLLGDSIKDQLRKETADRGLAEAATPDSNEACFIPDGDTRKFLRSQLGSSPGHVLDADRGPLSALTTGDVIDIKPVSRTVMAGPAENLDVREIEASRLYGPDAPRPRVRLNASSSCALTASPAGHVRGGWRDSADPPSLASPWCRQGLAAVLYDDDVVLGSATINAVSRPRDRVEPPRA